MVRSVRWFGAALIAAAVVSTADAQTTSADPNPTTHARAKHHAKQKADGRQVTVHKSVNGSPSWLTLGNDAQIGAGNNYVTSTFDQPSPVQGTFSGYRGRERIVPQYGVPGVPLFQF